MAEKTEKPTEKKRRDSAKKGQTFRSRDLVATVVLISGVFFLGSGMDFGPLIELYSIALLYNNKMTAISYSIQLVVILLQMCLPFIALCIVVGFATTLLQTKFSIATEALRFNIKALNPIEGFKRIFSLRTAKDFVKSFLYLGVLFGTCYTIIVYELKNILLVYHGTLIQLIAYWVSVTIKSILLFILWSVLILLAEFIVEYFLYIREMKMDKHEVKQERKELDGNPEIKRARRRAHHEILSSEERTAIRNSEVIMANPTHIAVAIYFNMEVAYLPFISLRCSNMKAQAAIAYAEKEGIPVVRDVKLARKLYSSYTAYSFISINDDALMAVMDILIWLRRVELEELDAFNDNNEVNEYEGEVSQESPLADSGTKLCDKKQ
ncbi:MULTISPECIES: EscU/YscU/HrcU family type III secretion system export apparatus switch protein [unclassified Symbiopectobacterium]|uniref:EscU/YscU/HrcU family type III secretion system export apparatus switch protein n=1 Tax=unclassified Symbiopectobacterium TaxID=2794573 RepID=UPI0022268F6B|nr:MULTISPECIES: EscU/YscU/HrcU family type III secretion system export apparatus switch protein [unclassified Symbiopectobacterium]MCW2474855.1 EscU/YscU/HrcU family type III secretion system export apparatus switch protein [Candidatus Symbiopectobacterium sp. NZEC151]MCW2482391.1 EscU/YscU/HrcU family type III secretion system export apparatus switch protein [Candidatus Symbiopectobacterium sp. NZEC135]